MPDPANRRKSVPLLRIHGAEPSPTPHLRIRPMAATPQRVAVALCGDPGYDEIGAMVTKSIKARGIDCESFQDGEQEAMEAELLLLIGTGSRFPKFAEMAQRYEHRRPTTVVWHLQPLPPPLLTDRASKLGERIRHGQWEDLLGTWAKRITNVAPARGGMQQMVQRLLSLQLRAEFSRIGGPEYGDVGWSDFCTIFDEADWLVKTFAEPRCWVDAVACSTPTRAAFLKQCGIAATFVPLGFHSDWGQIGTVERDIDVLFIGETNAGTRWSLVPDVLRQLRLWGYRTREVNLFPCGGERTSLLQRSKIVLNVLRLPWEFPGPRLFAGAACGALIVSNEAVQNEPFVAGLHFVRSPRLRMAESIHWFLAHEEERKRRAARALQSMSADLPLSKSIDGLLLTAGSAGNQAATRRAA